MKFAYNCPQPQPVHFSGWQRVNGRIMSTDEAEIIDFLTQNPDIWFTRKEISRKPTAR